MCAGRFDGWKATSSGITVSEAKRLKMLEDETLKLKALPAEQMPDVAALREPGRRQTQARVARPDRATHTMPDGIGGWPHPWKFGMKRRREFVGVVL